MFISAGFRFAMTYIGDGRSVAKRRWHQIFGASVTIVHQINYDLKTYTIINDTMSTV